MISPIFAAQLQYVCYLFAAQDVTNSSFAVPLHLVCSSFTPQLIATHLMLNHSSLAVPLQLTCSSMTLHLLLMLMSLICLRLICGLPAPYLQLGISLIFAAHLQFIFAASIPQACRKPLQLPFIFTWEGPPCEPKHK